MNAPHKYEEAPRADLEPLWTPRQLAAYFGINRETIYRWLDAGKLDGISVNGQWRIKRSEVERMANMRIKKITQPT